VNDLNEGTIARDPDDNLVRVVEVREKEVGLLTLTGEHAGKLGFLPHSHLEDDFDMLSEEEQEGKMEMVYDQLYGSVFSHQWVNVGDANPREHGGIFVKWKEEFVSGSLPDGYWRVITTTNAERQGLTGMVEEGGKYMFQDYMISPDDIWEDPLAPEEGISASGPMSVVGEGDTHPGNVERLVRAVPHAAREISYGTDTYTDNYWDKANSYGIYQGSV
jgi:hypothetical protein